MNKEELKLQRIVEFIRNHRTTHKEAREIIQQYADEQSRKRAVKFLLWNDDPDFEDEEIKQHYYAVYDNWQQNQEEQ